MSEWFKEPVLKTGVPKGTVGSNPTPSASSPEEDASSVVTARDRSGRRARWIYVLEEPFSWASPLRPTEDCAFQDREGHTRLLIETCGRITIPRDYAWDGATPKFHVLDMRFGTPEGATDRETRRPSTYHATLVHDALYQFLGDHELFHRIDADRCFAALLRERGFRARPVYYAAVRTFGGLWVRWIRYRRRLDGRLLVLSPEGAEELGPVRAV
jgi:hypothetical protein